MLATHLTTHVTSRLHSYGRLMRIDRPVGTLLLLWPTLMALWFASGGQPKAKLIIIFTLGAFLMRSAGCVINDFADRKIDGLVARTCQRPLVTGRVSSIEALLLFAVLISAAWWLVLLTNTMTVWLSVVAILLAALYPFTKRFTFYPQLFLGAAYAIAIPMAYAAQTEYLSFSCWVLYVATFVWTLAYDTLYAMADKEEDQLAGIKSIAIAVGQYDRALIAFAHTVVLLLLFALGWIFKLNHLFYVALTIAAVLAVYQQWQIRGRDPKACFNCFIQNQWFGLVLFAGVFLGFMA